MIELADTDRLAETAHGVGLILITIGAVGMGIWMVAVGPIYEAHCFESLAESASRTCSKSSLAWIVGNWWMIVSMGITAIALALFVAVDLHRQADAKASLNDTSSESGGTNEQ